MACLSPSEGYVRCLRVKSRSENSALFGNHSPGAYKPIKVSKKQKLVSTKKVYLNCFLQQCPHAPGARMTVVDGTNSLKQCIK